jgi:hypothetical protein
MGKLSNGSTPGICPKLNDHVALQDFRSISLNPRVLISCGVGQGYINVLRDDIGEVWHAYG